MLDNRLSYLYSNLISVKEIYHQLGADREKHIELDSILTEIININVVINEKPELSRAVYRNLVDRSEKVIDSIKPEIWKQYYQSKNYTVKDDA